MSYTDNLKIPAIVLTNARKNGICKWKQDDGIVCLVYSNGSIKGPFSESDADEIISATKDFRKVQENWNSPEFKEKKISEIRHKIHQKNSVREIEIAKNLRKMNAIFRGGK